MRPLLEAALQVARSGASDVPAIPPPRALVPLLNFSRLSERALATVRRVLDGNPDFRERVRASVTPEEVGADGWLFLARPEGWEAMLAESVEAAQADQLLREEERIERTAARRLARADEAKRDAQQLATALGSELAEATRQLNDERRARRASETEAGRLRARVARLQEEMAAGQTALAEISTVTAESDRLQAALDEAQEALASERREAAKPETAPRVSRSGDAEAVAAPGPVPAEAAQVARALAAAAAAVGVLAEAVHVAAAELAPFLPAPSTVPRPAWLPEPAPRRAGAASGPPAGGRAPSPLPPGVPDNSREAGEYLVRLTGVVVLVDGYNVTKLARAELTLPEQRRWLADAGAALAARSGADLDVVFDGAEDEAGVPFESPGRTKVRLRFSPLGIEADDVLLDLVDAMPLGRPVVVVSNDRRVQSGARRRGANVLSSDQLLVLLGSRPGAA